MFRLTRYPQLKKTASGGYKLRQVIRDHYLREDIPCGSKACKECEYHPDSAILDPPLDDNGPYYILDTNVLLHQMDLIESLPASLMTNLILLTTVLEEVRHHKKDLYKRVRALSTVLPHHNIFVFSNEFHKSSYVGQRKLGESPNDRNDRSIRAAAKFYSAHLNERIPIILVTEDRGNREKAEADAVETLSIKEFLQRNGKQYPQLQEIAARLESSEGSESGSSGDFLYPDHLPLSECQRLIATGELVQGTFRVNRDYWAEATVTVRGRDEQVFIPDVMSMNRAIDGDWVAVRILPKSQWRAPSRAIQPTMDEEEMVAVHENTESVAQETPNEAVTQSQSQKSRSSAAVSSTSLCTGVVVGIVRRNWRPYCGSLELTDKKTGKLLFLSVNKRIPRIRVESRQIESLLDKRILVQIDSWPRDSRYPLGHYTKTLGEIGDRDTETQVLLIEHEIPTAPWSKAVLACLPPNSHEIDPRDIPGREDFRHLSIFSIDPPGCTDIDDALHVRKLPNGNLEVGVHIADVSHYVRPGSALDAEGMHRGTSVYLVDKRIDMLPSLLSTNLCSLKSNVDRLAFSVLWELNENAEIIKTTFHKAVIRSVHSFTYGQAQDRIDTGDMSDPITWCCITLNNLAKKLKRKRIESGALMLASTEVKFLLDRESQTPTDVEMYQLKEANSLVEEFMLLANISVGKRILEAYPTFALLRRHPVPPPENFLPLQRAAKSAGFSIHCDTSRALADSLDRAQIPGYAFFNKLIRIMATRAMSQALYFSSGDCSPPEYFHYGLAAPVYTHFTSPIRRYADIVVHRLLAASMGLPDHPLYKDIQDKEKVRDMADNINHRHRMAQLVSRASTELFTLIYFKDKRVREEAVIVQLKANGIRVIVPRYGLEHAITLFKDSTKPGSAAIPAKNPYNYDEETLCLRGPNGVQFKIFERVVVEIYVAEGANRRKWLAVDLVEPEKGSSVNLNISQYKSTGTGSVKRDQVATIEEIGEEDEKFESQLEKAAQMADEMPAAAVVNRNADRIFATEEQLERENAQEDAGNSGSAKKANAKNAGSNTSNKKQKTGGK